MVSAARINYLLLVAVGVFWVLSGLFYLSGGAAGPIAFTGFGVRIDNVHVIFGVLEVTFGLFWLYIVTTRSDGEISIGR